MVQSLSNLPIGSKVKFGKHSVNGETPWSITWTVVAMNHRDYPSNSVTLLTDKIIDLRAVDGQEWGLPDQPVDLHAGNNNYGLSNIDAWLNSHQTSWYTSKHTMDTSPNSSTTSYGTEYVDLPGFLSNFSEEERNAILPTTIVVTKYYCTTENLTRQVFLPSLAEIGLTATGEPIDGSLWSYFATYSRATSIAPQCYANTRCGYKSTDVTGNWSYWVRSAYSSLSRETYRVTVGGYLSNSASDSGSEGIRPAINLASSTLVTDTTDAEGCYTVVFNSPPSTPAILNVPTIYGGKSNPISWSNSTDIQGDAITYQLECSMNGGNYEQVYSGTSAVYAHIVPFGTSTVTYRVKATDPSGMSSAYITSSIITVINNNAPVISGSDSNLGVKSEGFIGAYSITDANYDTVTVTEAIDGVQIRALVVGLGDEIIYGVTGGTWLTLPNGSHTLTISATDGIDTTVRTYLFTKLVDSFSIQNSAPWASSTMPSRIMLVVTRNIPTTSTFKVEVCNNGYDTSPTWEDATDAVVSGLVHVFSNKTKTATDWGVRVKVTVERNGATGACYVSAIGGNFE